MPRSLINVLGAVATVAVLAIGLFLLAGPLAFQAVDVAEQTAGVAQTNAVYQAQVDSLRDQEDDIDDIQASVADLQTQITPTNQLDDVFELVAKAAAASRVSIDSITAGEPTPFIVRTSASPLSEDAEAASEDAPVVEAPATAEDTTDGATANAAASEPAAPPTGAGRAQVDFSITLKADRYEQVVDFLDRLRSGPRLLGQVQSIMTETGTGFDVSMTALAFTLTQEG